MMLDDISLMLPDELNSRPSLLHLDTVPVMGENFDIMLFKGDVVVSAPSGKMALGQTILAAAREYLLCPDADFLAIVLHEYDRVALVAPLPSASMGEGLVMLPGVGAHSMVRVLRYAFADQVRLHDASRGYDNTNIREADKHTYQYLQVLLSRCRVMFGGAGVLSITDRKQLSHQLILILRKMEAFFGMDFSSVHVREFPVSFAYEGTFCPTKALWMLLCLTLGITRGCTRRVHESLRFVLDEEMLLPMLEMSMGNKTKLPVEWEECRRMTEQEGMFFDIRRKRDAICVRFCPMTPRIAPHEFYSVRAMAPIIEGIRKMKLQ